MNTKNFDVSVTERRIDIRGLKPREFVNAGHDRHINNNYVILHGLTGVLDGAICQISEPSAIPYAIFSICYHNDDDAYNMLQPDVSIAIAYDIESSYYIYKCRMRNIMHYGTLCNDIVPDELTLTIQDKIFLDHTIKNFMINSEEMIGEEKSVIRIV